MKDRLKHEAFNMTFILAFMVIICCFILAGITAVDIAQEPEAIGRFFGEIVKGFKGVK